MSRAVPVVTLVACAVCAAPSSAQAAGTRVLQLDFSSGSLASSGTARVSVHEVTRSSGSLRFVSGLQGQGTAVRTPAFDPSADGPRAAITVVPSSGDPLSPGTQRFSFGADVKLDSASTASKSAGSTDNGDNVVQRGLYASGSTQYKIQVDGDVPSCRIRGTSGTVMVHGSALTRGVWYRLSCLREGSTVTLYVMRYAGDGALEQTRSYTGHGATGSVRTANARVPLSVGGAVHDDGTLKASCDQFNGQIDFVSVAVG
jgi:hypothetical protein